MPHQPSLALTIEDILLGAELREEKKRHATFFPSSLNLVNDFCRQEMEKDSEDEDEYSTWEFHAPVEPFIARRLKPITDPAVLPAHQSSYDPVVLTGMSAAQRVAYQYRSGLKIDLDDSESFAKTFGSRSSSTSPQPSTLIGSGSSSLAYQGSHEINSHRCTLIEEPKLRHSESCAGALEIAHQEALQEVKFGMGKNGIIVCPRKDCRATLSSVRALGYHIALHDIEKPNHSPYTCPACDKGFDKRQALNNHSCPARSRSAPASPIFATFQHVLTRITSRE